MQPGPRGVGDAGEHIGKPGPRIDIVELGRPSPVDATKFNKPARWVLRHENDYRGVCFSSACSIALSHTTTAVAPASGTPMALAPR